MPYLEKTDGCIFEESLNARGELSQGNFQILEAGQQELGLEAEVDLRAKSAEWGLLLWYEVLRGMAELFHPQTTPPPPQKTASLSHHDEISGTNAPAG